MIFSKSIRFISLPSMVFSTLFLWNAVVYLVVSKFIKPIGESPLKYLYFGLCCLFLGLFSLSNVFLYSSESFSQAGFWQSIQAILSFPIFIFFILFSQEYLGLSSWYWRRFLPILTVIMMGLALMPGALVTTIPNPKTFVFFNYSTQINEVDLGPIGLFFLTWFMLHLIALGLYWLWKFKKSERRNVHFITYIIFTLSCLNDSMVAAGWYSFYYLLELGFVAYIFGMSLQMLQSYIDKSREISVKSAALQKLNREMLFLMSAISHDLTAPLFSIQGFIEKLKSSPNSLDDHALKRIEANAQHLKTLFDDLLTFLKAGRVCHKKEWVDLSSLLEEVLTVLQAKELFPYIKLDLPSVSIRWWGDRIHLRQILLNLIQNSLKHSPPPEAFLKIEMELKEDQLQCCIEDSGTGIPNELHEKVFEAFFQADFREPGKGLGLAIVKKLVESEGGKVWVDTECSRGTRICFWLPAPAENPLNRSLKTTIKKIESEPTS